MGFRFLFPLLDRANRFPALYFNGTTTRINVGNDASLNDLPSGGTWTIDTWARFDSTGSTEDMIIHKGQWNVTGYRIFVSSSGTIFFTTYLPTTNSQMLYSNNVRDDTFHHIAAYYDDTSKKCRLAVDGSWTDLSTAGAGVYASEAAREMMLGRISDQVAWYMKGYMGWMRLSDNDRFNGAAGTSFTPPARYPAPATDVNTIEQWNMDAGTGTTVVAQVNSPANDGTIIGTATWVKV